MRNRVIVLLLGGWLLATCGANWGFAQREQNGDQAALMEKWIDFMTPGAEHELLKQRVGKWKVKMQMWAAPDAEAMTSEGTSEINLIMDGRYLSGTTRSSFQSQSFEGRSLIGFDKLKKRFVSVSIDNFGTGFVISTGTYDKATKTFTYASMSPDIALGDYKRTKTLERNVSQDEWVLEVYDTTKDDGKEFLTFKAVYTRDKS